MNEKEFKVVGTLESSQDLLIRKNMITSSTFLKDAQVFQWGGIYRFSWLTGRDLSVQLNSEPLI